MIVTMPDTLVDLLRVLILLLAGVAAGVLTATNVVAYLVLRPPKHLGFLWWHVTAVSVVTILLLVVAVDGVFHRYGGPAVWQTWVTLVAVLLLNAAMVLVFRIERARYLVHRHRDGLHL